MINKILFLFVIGMVFSCSTIKPKTITRPVDLEHFLTTNKEYLKIPISKMVSGHLHIHATVNGIEGAFILDTGAGVTIIDPNNKKKFNLETEQTDIRGAGAGGQTNLEKSSNNVFLIGELEKQAFSIYLMNLDHVNTALTSMGLNKVDGVIGADILTSNKEIIDYSNLVLYLKK